MKHGIFGSNLSRSRDEKKRLIRGLSRDLFLRGAVTTTRAKAKAIQPMVEKLITTAKEGTEFSYRKMLSILGDAAVVKMVIADAKTRFAARTSGYTRIVRVNMHRSDAADMVIMAFVDQKIVAEVVAAPKTKAEAPASEAKKPAAKKEAKETKPKVEKKKATSKK
jgi:large subunit ribosomal protein L17